MYSKLSTSNKPDAQGRARHVPSRALAEVGIDCTGNEEQGEENENNIKFKGTDSQ